MTTHSIRNTLLVVGLNISAWEARRQDRKVNKEVADAHGTASTVGRYHKDLLPAATEHEAVLLIRNEWRRWYYENTLPWGDDSGRVIRSFDYLDFALESQSYEQRWNAAVKDFLAAYPTLVAQAELRLNTLFDPNDYPSVQEVKNRFGVRLTTYPLPDAEDFRIIEGIPPDEAERLCKVAVEGLEAHLNEAITDLWKRMFKVVAAMQEKLVVPIGKPGGRFHDTLVDNISELVELLPRLNLTGSAEINAIADDMHELTRYPAEILRTSPEARDTTAARAAAIAERMKAYV
jgi:hypothetical protein